MNQDIQYNDYVNLIYKSAWALINNGNTDQHFDDLVSDGNLAFAECLTTWDPDKGAFSTHLTWRVRFRMSRGMKQRRRKIGCRGCPTGNGSSHPRVESMDSESFPDQYDHGPGPYEYARFREAMAGLGAEAREVVELVLGSPLEICDLTLQSIQVTRKRVIEYLRGLGWTMPRVNRAMNEIKATF